VGIPQLSQKFSKTSNPGTEQNTQNFCHISEKCLNMCLLLWTCLHLLVCVDTFVIILF